MSAGGLLVAPAALAPACSGGPSLLLLPGVDPAAFDLPGLALWCVAAPAEEAGGAHRLHRPGEDPAEATLPLPGLPAGILAILAAAAAEEAEALLALWQPGAAPPVLAPAGLPALARLLAAEAVARSVEAARLQRGMARLREEAEETRAAMAALLQATGHDAPPPPALVLSAEPSLTARVQAAGGALRLGQALGTSLEGVSAVALHVADAAIAAPERALLSIRLFGAESGRVRGAWTLPGAALRAGWLVLDLPSPLGPLREGACLAIAAELDPADRLALALEEAEAPAGRAAVLESGEGPGGQALALRLWTAPFGRRFVLAPHWDWEAEGVPLGVPQRLPEQAWAALRVLSGQGGPVALGEAGGGARPVMTLSGAAQEALLMLPAVPLSGLDLLEARLAVPLGEAGALEAALWVLPDAETPLAPELPGVRCTGWLPAEPARGALTLALRLPPGGLGPMPAAVALALRHRGVEGRAEVLPLRVEWTGLAARRLRPDLPAPRPGEAAGAPPSPGLLAAAPPGAVPALEGEVRLHELYGMEGGGYRHLDIRAEGLRLGALAWPRLRFKFAVNGGAPQIEMRARPDWPAMFERWPGGHADEHGPFFLLTEADRGGRAMARLRSERDRRLLAALLQLLPGLVATAARAATVEPADYADWVAMARRLAAALLAEGEDGAS